MGWARGSEIAEGIIDTVKKHVPKHKTRVEIYKDVIETLDHNDWDTHSEALGIDPAFDEAMQEVHPSHFEYEE